MPNNLTIPIWPEGVPGSLPHVQDLEEVISGPNSHRMLRNVTEPTLEIILPKPEVATGTALIICPGGAFHFLSIDNEGYAISDWLTDLGIATFIL